ncbi:MAG: DegT/DnrJ/EryC1/StrS family aminotransferase, partial [Elusimicrobiota bacterium]
TFIATATAVSELGAVPLFVDVEPESLNLDPADLRRRLNKKTKAVIPVHLYGHPADMDGVLAAAKDAGLAVVEDCAQAHLARSRGRPVGALGDYGAFSFYPSKNLGAIGDAGALSTKDPALHEAAVVLRNVGRKPGGQYEHVRIGRNARLDEIQAAFLRVKLKRLASWTESRARLAKRYLENLKGLPLRLPPADGDGTQSAWHLFVIQTPKRDALAAHLKKAGISTAVYYPQPLHLQAAYRFLGGKAGDLPESERASAEVLALPFFPELAPEKTDRVVEEIRRFFGE